MGRAPLARRDLRPYGAGPGGANLRSVDNAALSGRRAPMTTTRARGRRRRTVRPSHPRPPAPKRPLGHPFTRVWREVAQGEWRWIHVEARRAPE